MHIPKALLDRSFNWICINISLIEAYIMILSFSFILRLKKKILYVWYFELKLTTCNVMTIVLKNMYAQCKSMHNLQFHIFKHTIMRCQSPFVCGLSFNPPFPPFFRKQFLLSLFHIKKWRDPTCSCHREYWKNISRILTIEVCNRYFTGPTKGSFICRIPLVLRYVYCILGPVGGQDDR